MLCALIPYTSLCVLLLLIHHLPAMCLFVVSGLSTTGTISSACRQAHTVCVMHELAESAGVIWMEH